MSFFRRNFKGHQDVRRKGSKTMNKNTLVWSKCYATIVLPKVDNQIWFYTLRSAFLDAQRIFSQKWKATIVLWNFEATPSGS